MASRRAPDPQSSEMTVRGSVIKKIPLLDPTSHAASVTATGAGDWADLSGCYRYAVVIVNGATNSVIFNVEGTPDWQGTGFVTLATRANSSAAYSATAVTVTGGSTAVLFMSPDDLISCIRVNVGTANANGTTFTAYGWAEG